MGLSIVSILCAVVVSNLHHQSIMDRDVPNGLKAFARRLNRFIFIRPRRRPLLSACDKNRDSREQVHLKESMSHVTFGTMTYHNEFPLQGYETTFSNGSTRRKRSRGSFHVTASSTPSSRDPSPHRISHRESLKRVKCCGSSSCGNETLVKQMSTLLKRQENVLKELEDGRLNREWHEIAEIIDRFLFCVYFIISVSVTIIILVLVPLGKTVKIR